MNRTWLIGKVFERVGNSRDHLGEGALMVSADAHSVLAAFGVLWTDAMKLDEAAWSMVTPWGNPRVVVDTRLQADNLYYDRAWKT